MSKSIYHSDYLGERAIRNTLLQLKRHQEHMAKRVNPTPEQREADERELARLRERLEYGSNFNNW